MIRAAQCRPVLSGAARYRSELPSAAQFSSVQPSTVQAPGRCPTVAAAPKPLLLTAAVAAAGAPPRAPLALLALLPSPQLQCWPGARHPPAIPPISCPARPRVKGMPPSGYKGPGEPQSHSNPTMPPLAVLLLALALLCAWRLSYSQGPTGTGTGRPRSLPALPLVGSLLQLAGHPQLHLRLWRLQGRYGSLYGLWMGSHYVVVVNSYQHAREVLLKKGKAFAGRPRTVSHGVTATVLADPLVWGEDAAWGDPVAVCPTGDHGPTVPRGKGHRLCQLRSPLEVPAQTGACCPLHVWGGLSRPGEDQ